MGTRSELTPPAPTLLPLQVSAPPSLWLQPHPQGQPHIRPFPLPSLPAPLPKPTVPGTSSVRTSCLKSIKAPPHPQAHIRSQEPSRTFGACASFSGSSQPSHGGPCTQSLHVGSLRAGPDHLKAQPGEGTGLRALHSSSSPPPPGSTQFLQGLCWEFGPGQDGRGHRNEHQPVALVCLEEPSQPVGRQTHAPG